MTLNRPLSSSMGVREKEVGAGGTSGGASVTDQQKSAVVINQLRKYTVECSPRLREISHPLWQEVALCHTRTTKSTALFTFKMLSQLTHSDSQVLLQLKVLEQLSLHSFT